MASELFNFPFQANVWGTASDWFMVFVTALTAIYLIKTFRSQREVQKLQYKSTIIENEKYRIANLPYFKVEISTTPVKNLHESFEYQLTIVFELLNSHIKHVKANIKSVDSLIKDVGENHYTAHNVERGSKNKMTFDVLTPENSFKDRDGSYINFVLSYIDPVENIYEQTGNIIVKEGLTKLSIDDQPLLVSI